MTDLEQLENARAAFGFHPDSDMDLSQMIFELRNRERELFHNNTKLVNKLEELRGRINNLEMENHDLINTNRALVNLSIELKDKIRELEAELAKFEDIKEFL